jgi:hypothetical protein
MKAGGAENHESDSERQKRETSPDEQRRPERDGRRATLRADAVERRIRPYNQLQASRDRHREQQRCGAAEPLPGVHDAIVRRLAPRNHRPGE